MLFHPVTDISAAVAVVTTVVVGGFVSAHLKTLTAWYKSKVPENLQVLFQGIVSRVEQDLQTSTGQAKFKEAVARAQAVLAGLGIYLPLVAIESGIQLAFDLLVKAGTLNQHKAQTTVTSAPTVITTPRGK